MGGCTTLYLALWLARALGESHNWLPVGACHWPRDPRLLQGRRKHSTKAQQQTEH